ncbi:MAG: kelch repeat-containing protein [Pseudomonadota bacterium]|nr:kelch repeat-containing protein [Pseudomonadota bacterium]
MSSAFDIPGGGAAPVIDTSALATKTQLANAVAAIIAAIPPAAGGGGGAVVGEVKNIALDSNGQLPAGYALVNSNPTIPLGGLDFTFVPAAGVAAFAVSGSFGSSVAQDKNGVLHYLLGYNDAGHVEFNPATGIAAMGASVPTSSTSDGALARLASGRIIAVGMAYYNYGNYTPNANAYVLNAGSWGVIASLPVLRWRPSLALLGNGKMLAVGGNTDAGYWAGMTGRCDVYDETTNTWTQVADAPVRGIGPAVSLPDGTVLWTPYFTYDGSANITSNNRAYVYDPAANYWTETDALPEAGTLSGTMGLAADEAGALLTGAAVGAPVRRYTAANAPGTRWSNLRYVGPVINASPSRGAFVVKLLDGRVFAPTTLVSGATSVINVRYNAGNTVVAARKT